jgi:hypothetical protein
MFQYPIVGTWQAVLIFFFFWQAALQRLIMTVSLQKTDDWWNLVKKCDKKIVILGFKINGSLIEIAFEMPIASKWKS